MRLPYFIIGQLSALQCFLLLLVIAIGYSSCLGWGDVAERIYWSDPNYYVADDERVNCKILYRKLVSGNAIGRITCITKLGFNDWYIIAESHLPQNDTIKQYWILKKADDDELKNADQVVDGPFTFIDFNREKLNLGLEDLKFRKKWD